jgi:hypothetical protein
MERNIYKIGKELFIISDEEIKEGDWVFNFEYNYIVQYNSEKHDNKFWYKKIILTTDQDLIKDGVQAIDDEFLEWFVKNPSCEFIRVEQYWDTKNMVYGVNTKPYKIFIPQEEPKQEIVGYRLKPSINRKMVDGILKNAMPVWNNEDKSVYFIRGHVAGSLVAKMKELQVLDLWFTPIYENEEVKSDWAKEHHLEYYHKEGIMKAKQETLEEAAKKHAETISKFPQWNEHDAKIFKAGAKWQAEKKYSKEDMISFAEFVATYTDKNKNVHSQMLHAKSKYDGAERTIDLLKIWFEQHKRK